MTESHVNEQLNRRIEAKSNPDWLSAAMLSGRVERKFTLDVQETGFVRTEMCMNALPSALESTIRHSWPVTSTVAPGYYLAESALTQERLRL